MADDKTFLLTIHPGGKRKAVIELLARFGIEDFVEAASDTINADDGDWEVVFQNWSTRDDAPLLVYRPARDELEPLMAALTKRFGSDLTFQGKWISNDLWQEAWEPDFQYLETAMFFIGADPSLASPDKVQIILGEGSVFGSGQHATTQALVRLLESEVRPTSTQSFLDVGTGTGVLAFVAHHLGYSRVVGTDIEPDAIEAARQNAKRNGLPLMVVLGSLPVETERFDVIACNILPPTLTDLLSLLDTLLKPQGRLYLAGFHEANQDQIRTELDRLGYSVSKERKARGWLGWMAQRDS